ncbi:MAG TPA: carboxypeptidase-like regulatory domain-containing protein, partial [Acidobacteriota bacterium]|nr:carboxypeptidase-like regulatory domain-containing protein [Acidobacteriota bacterium]
MHTAIRIFIGTLLMVAILSTQVAASWQAAKIKGLVNGIQADGSKLPLAGAVVTLRGTALTTKDPVTVTTDEEGRYTLFDLLPGDYQLTIEVPGFESYSKSYKIVSGAVSAITVDLRIKETKEAVVEIKANPNEI